MEWMALGVTFMVASAAGATMITYSRWSANRHRVMVMDETGADPVEVYVGPKFSPYRPSPTISPPHPNGTWIAWSEGALYKVRADGGGLTKVLCDGIWGDGGWYSDGTPYGSVLDAQWSPEGTEILVMTLQPEDDPTFLGLLPSEFAVGTGATGADCRSGLLKIYTGAGDGYGIEGTAAWNEDGSRIAFFEYDQHSDIRLVILERQTGWQPIVVPTSLGHGGWFNQSLDWQRGGGNLLAFSTRYGTEPKGPVWLNWIDATNGSWGYLTEGGSRLEGDSPSWSPDGSQLVFSDDRGELVKWTYQLTSGDELEGSTELLRSGERPDWQREPPDVLCTADADCPDDNNICTREICVSGTCTWEASWLPCDDQDACTWSDGCDANGDCVGEPIPEGQDCAGQNGICCAGECVQAPSCEACVPTHSKEKGPRCSDGVDNDCDGLTDSADPDC